MAFQVAVAQRFACDGRIMISAYDGQSTRVYYPIFIPFGMPFLVSLTRYADRAIDAVGFNPEDFYLYGVDQRTKEVLRMRRDGGVDVLGVLPGDTASGVLAGDCTPAGQYMCYDPDSHQLLLYDVADQLSLASRIDLYWDPESGVSGPFNSGIFDIAIDPENPTIAYTYQGVGPSGLLGPQEMSGRILTINVDPLSDNYGMVSPAAQLSPNRLSHLGGILATAGSRLYGFGTLDEGVNSPQRVLYSLDPIGGQVVPILSASFAAELSDGCTCPYSFSFTLLAPSVGIYCNNDVQTFRLSISNNSFTPIGGVRLRDTFAEGMIIDAISDTYTGLQVDGSGVGTRVLAIDDLMIPAKSTVEVDVEIRSIDARVGEQRNQAILEGLPERFGGPFLSDDPYSTGVQGDSSYYVVAARRLEDVAVEVRLPSDCIAADDGAMTVQSQQLVPGQVLEVGLRNQDGWTVSWHTVTIDDSSSFTIEALLPGAYQLFSIRSLEDRCSLALKDTIITIDPPHEQLSLEVSSNAAICAGDTLRLSSRLSPGGDILWSGPTLWSSASPDPVITSTDEDWSGTYKAVATYGYCEQEVLLPVDVLPRVAATALGSTTYCLRDTLRLAVDTGQDSLLYRWSGPDFSGVDSLAEITLVNATQAGSYSVVADNGGCSDTATVVVDIWPTPTVDLPQEIITDFCEPVTLIPSVVGGGRVDYTWSPTQGLSCLDCATTTVLPPVQPHYQVRVSNQWCADSAKVQVVLDKSTLLTAPNVFRPSSTVGNDRFAPVPRCVVDDIISLRVFDRWGGVVYDSYGRADIGWHGLVDGRVATSGVYLWSSQIRLVDGSIYHLSGDLLLTD